MAVGAAPAIRFATTRDGVRIAYTSHGEGPPLLYVRGWISHLEWHWNKPAFRAYFETLGQHFRIVRFDMRGNGLSDREAPAFTLDDFVLDVEAVAEAAGLDRFVIYGSSFGAPISIAYAAKHPGRVTRMVLDSPYARGRDIANPEQLETLVKMFRTMPDIAAVAMSKSTHPSDPEDVFRRSREGWQAITSDVAAILYEVGFNLDLTDLLPLVTMPALVLHRRKNRSIPFELGRRLAGQLPDAGFVALEGRDQDPWGDDPRPGLAAIAEFLGVDLEPSPAATGPDSMPLTVLFTDMAGSTPLTQRLGDAEAQVVVRAHNRIVRKALREAGGTEIKHTGDGIMASFVSPSRALTCAGAIQEGLARHNALHRDAPCLVRIGLNAGEPVQEEADLYGTAVQLAARICDQARPGSVLVSQVVRDLAAGKGFRFSDRGKSALKGFTTPVHLYELEWKEEPAARG